MPDWVIGAQNQFNVDVHPQEHLRAAFTPDGLVIESLDRGFLGVTISEPDKNGSRHVDCVVQTEKEAIITGFVPYPWLNRERE